MTSLSSAESGLLAAVSPTMLMRHTATLAQWEKTSGTPAERAAVDYLREQLESFGIRTTLHEFESLLGWPEGATLEVQRPTARAVHAIVHAFTPSTPPEGITAPVAYLGAGEEQDFARANAAGAIPLIEGMPAPVKILRAQRHEAAGLIFIQDDRLLHELCVSPVWGTPTTRTGDLLPRLPVVSIQRPDGEALKELARQGQVTVRLWTKTFWGWRTTPLLTGDIPGPEAGANFVLLSGHHCSWYYGAMDNGTANATILEVARLLAERRADLRRGVRIAFWPGHTHGRYSGSTWYFDHFWEELHDHCLLHVNVDSTGARGATLYRALAMPETQRYALDVIHDALGVEAEPERQSRAGDQSFWGCGVPSIFMDLSQVPAELAANTGSSLFRAADQPSGTNQGGLPWWWHTPEDTLDKIDPDVLARDTQVYLLATWRAASAVVFPFLLAANAREVRETIERYQAAAGDRFDLGLVIERARQVEDAALTLDALLDRIRGRADAARLAPLANAGAMALERTLVALNFTANGPFDQDLAVPIPAVPLLEPARRLKDLDPAANATKFLLTDLIRGRNKVAYALREARRAAEETIAALNQALAELLD
jgi:Iap family predicted aminopeptidase